MANEMVNVMNNDLFEAAKYGYIENVERLLDEGANINFNRYGTTALMISSTNNYTEIVKLLGRESEIDLQDNGGWTALMMASLNGHMETAQILLDYNALPNIIDDNGETALILASMMGHPDIVELLLNKGANINIVNDDGDMALDIAVVNGNTDIVEILNRHNASSNIQRRFRGNQIRRRPTRRTLKAK